MKLRVNGQSQYVPDGTTIRQLVQRFNFTPEKVAIELNRRLVRADRYDQTLNENDEIEIVTFVGGGA